MTCTILKSPSKEYHSPMDKMTFKEGSIVKVKKGVLDPDFGGDISGWQGKISKVEDDFVCIDWDKITLSQCPDEYIKQAEEKGLDWEQIYLSIEDVEPALPRITPASLKNIKETQRIKHQWDHLGEATSRCINEVLKDANIADEYSMMMAWEHYLNNHLSLPFDAEITESQENVSLHQGEKVKIHRIIVTDDHYGVIMNLRQSKNSFDFPLCSIRVADETSNNYKIVEAYNEWFSNR